MTSIAFGEATGSGVADALVYGSDEAKKGAKCKSGSYTISNNVITFKDCVGLFDEDGAASGVIDVTDDNVEAKDLVIKYSNGESDKVNGKLVISESATAVTFTSTGLSVVTQELSSSNKLIPVNYNLTDYKFVWSPQDATTAKLQVSGKLSSTGNEGGDYKVAFDSMATPFFAKMDEEEELLNYPYSGTLNINDLNNNANSIVLSAINDQTAQYKAISAGKVLFDKVANWSEIDDY